MKNFLFLFLTHCRTPRTELTPQNAGLSPDDMKKDISGIIHDLIPNGFFTPNDKGPFTIEDLQNHLTYHGSKRNFRFNSIF